MNTAYTALLACLIVGCGHMHQVRVAGFESYLEAFKATGALYGWTMPVDDIVIEYGILGNLVLGSCTEGPGSPTVRINQHYWAQETDTRRKLVMFHELGHCLLDRQHKGNTIMQAQILLDEVYLANPSWYDRELFTGGN